MEVKIRVPEKVAAAARAKGVSVEVYVEELLARQAAKAATEEDAEATQAAVGRIRKLRKGNKLAGLRTKDLIHEGHRY